MPYSSPRRPSPKFHNDWDLLLDEAFDAQLRRTVTLSPSGRGWFAAMTGAKAAIVSLLLMAAAGVVWQLATAERFTWAAGCGNDGAQYCQMAAGQLATEPYSRRILLPGIVSQLGLSGADGFALVNAFVLFACLAAFVYLCVMELGRGQTPLVGLVTALAALVFLSNRNTIHLYLAGPVLTDFMALFFLFVGCVALIKMSRDGRWVAVAAGAAFAGALTRENLAIILVAAAVFATITRTVRWPTILPILGAGLAGTLIAFSQPTLTVEHKPILDVIVLWIAADFVHPGGFVRFGVMVPLGMGPLAFACPAWARPIWRDEVCRVLAATAIIFTGVSIFAGGDTDRILMPAGLLFAACVLRLYATGVVRLGPLLLLVAAAWIWQLPFVVVAGDPTSVYSFWALRVTPISDVLTFGLAPILIGVPLVAAAFLLQVRPKVESPVGHDAVA